MPLSFLNIGTLCAFFGSKRNICTAAIKESTERAWNAQGLQILIFITMCVCAVCTEMAEKGKPNQSCMLYCLLQPRKLRQENGLFDHIGWPGHCNHHHHQEEKSSPCANILVHKDNASHCHHTTPFCHTNPHLWLCVFVQLALLHTFRPSVCLCNGK